MRVATPVSLLAASTAAWLHLTGCTDPGAAVSVATEPAGANCPQGGVRIDDGSGELRYVCHGASGSAGEGGSSPTITSEPAGPNCPEGGLRVEVDGEASYLCNGTSAEAAKQQLCPADTLRNDPNTVGVYLEVRGSIQGDIIGSDTSSLAGTIEALATCHGVASPFDPVSGLPSSTVTHAPFTVVTAIDRATPALYNALTRNEALTVTVHHFGRNPETGATVATKRIELASARAVRIEQITAEDPENAGTFRDYQRISFAYRTYTMQKAGVPPVTAEAAGFAPLEPAPACVAIEPGARLYLRAVGSRSGNIAGEVAEKGKEGLIAVNVACHDLVSPSDPATGLPTGKTRHSPLVLVKPEDRATSGLLKTLVEREPLNSLELQYWRPTDLGGSRHEFTIRLTDAATTSYDGLASDGTRLDRFAFTYRNIEWTWVNGGHTAAADW